MKGCEQQLLMRTLDSNKRQFGLGKLQFATAELKKGWGMRQGKRFSQVDGTLEGDTCGEGVEAHRTGTFYFRIGELEAKIRGNRWVKPQVIS
jgi:Domain of unknown function (DUF4113)